MNRLKIEEGKLHFKGAELWSVKPPEILIDTLTKVGKNEAEMRPYTIEYKELTKQEKLTLLEYLKLQVEDKND